MNRSHCDVTEQTVVAYHLKGIHSRQKKTICQTEIKKSLKLPKGDNRGVASEFILVRRNGRLARGIWGHAPPRKKKKKKKKGAILCYLGAFPRLYFRLSEGHNITIFFFDLNVTL